MGAYKYLMIHCTATIEGNKLDPEDIERMHKVGRGWDRVGYSKVFFEDGRIHDFVDHNDDNWISSDEVTYGAVGFNGVTKHWCYQGGLGKDFQIVGGKRNYPFRNTMTQEQELNLAREIREEIRKHPHIKIIGHNQTAVKGCPCFDVRAWCQLSGVPDENIDTRPLKVYLKHEKNVFTAPDHPFANKAEGDKFRAWVNEKHPAYARKIDLDRSGSHTNAWIMRAWKKLGKEYKS